MSELLTDEEKLKQLVILAEITQRELKRAKDTRSSLGELALNSSLGMQVIIKLKEWGYLENE